MVGFMGGLLVLAAAMLAIPTANAQARGPVMVRIAELEIDPAQLDAYKVMLAEEQEASIRLEPGVIMLHSVALADRPNHIRILEVYADKAAYDAHIRSPHFVKYKTGTAAMVRSLRLVPTTPIRLCAKADMNLSGTCFGSALSN